MSILRPFFYRAWIELFFQAWLVKNLLWGSLIYSNFETNIERFVARVEYKDARYKTYWPGCVSHTFSWAQKLQLAPTAMRQFFGQKTITSLQTLLTGIKWPVMLAWKFSSAARERIFEPKMLKIDNCDTFLSEMRRRNYGDPKEYRLTKVGEIRSPTTSHGLNFGTAVVGRAESETLVRYSSSQTWAVQVPYGYLTWVRYSAAVPQTYAS
jgi:hypothetical protein